MSTNTYSVEAEITRKIVVEVEATSMEEAKDLVAADPDGYETKEDTQEISIGSTTWSEVEALWLDLSLQQGEPLGSSFLLMSMD